MKTDAHELTLHLPRGTGARLAHKRPSVPKPPHEQLAAWRHEQQLSITAAARRIDVQFVTYQAIEAGRTTPRLQTAALIEEVTGIPMAAWLQK